MIDIRFMRRYESRKLRFVDKGVTYEGFGGAERIWGGCQVIRIDLIEPKNGIKSIYAPADEIKVI